MASVTLAVACGGETSGPGLGVPRAELLGLARVVSAEPSPAFCVFKNNVASSCQLTHTDAVRTMFAAFAFAPHSVVSRNDTLFCDTCTIIVTATVAPGSYEFTVGPASLVFNQAGEPVVAVSFARYGDPSVYTQSPRYASAAEFTQAVQLWRERAPDRWVLGRNSGHTGPTTVTSALEAPGTFLIAAPK
ncbi:MAG: hypothetical protein ACREMF_04205 [Gemmatimonadales bacterium]